uniref:Ribonuclease G/E-like protein n=1 Tax=Streptomyces sp. 44030 TaxID=364102 RepID=Q2LEV7_9ACTN|nr:ribonuclease G/E-like protein [Streptomyces sp. 44030]ABC67358.1 ribonuclease G/E-like protein [Streptomyces sp. 44030]
MCRAGGRRCPNCGGGSAAERRNAARIRKQRSVAGKALREALTTGDTTAVRTAEQKLRAIEGGDTTAKMILGNLPGQPETAVEASEPAAPAPRADTAEPGGNTAPGSDPVLEEQTQTKSGSPAHIEAWLNDLRRQGYTILGTSETEAGRNLRVTARFAKVPSHTSGPAVRYAVQKVRGSSEHWLDQIKAQGFTVHTTTEPNSRGIMRDVAEIRRTAPDPGTDTAAIERLTRAAYNALASCPQDWIPLRVLRPLIGGDRKTVDNVLIALEKTGAVVVVPESNTKVLTDADRSAALHRGSEDKHLLAFELEEYLD